MAILPAIAALKDALRPAYGDVRVIPEDVVGENASAMRNAVVYLQLMGVAEDTETGTDRLMLDVAARVQSSGLTPHIHHAGQLAQPWGSAEYAALRGALEVGGARGITMDLEYDPANPQQGVATYRFNLYSPKIYPEAIQPAPASGGVIRRVIIILTPAGEIIVPPPGAREWGEEFGPEFGGVG